MKKVKVLILATIMLCCSLAFLGCGKNDNNGFVEVYSVTYDKTTLTSQVDLEFGKPIEITEEEYKNTQDDYKVRFKSSYALSRDRSSEVTVDDSQRYSISLKEISKISTSDYYFGFGNGYSYYKYSVKNIDVKYVRVKILNERSILVKDIDGFETLINTDFFISYFKN